MSSDTFAPPLEWLNHGDNREWKLTVIADESAVYRGDVIVSFRMTGSIRYQAGDYAHAKELKQVAARWM